MKILSNLVKEGYHKKLQLWPSTDEDFYGQVTLGVDVTPKAIFYI